MAEGYRKGGRVIAPSVVLVKDDGSTVPPPSSPSTALADGQGLQRSFRPGERVIADGVVGVKDDGSTLGLLGTNGQVLTLVGGLPAWATPTAGGGGMANPMTTQGDIITGGVAGAPQRLPVGANNQVLTVVGGVPAWAAPSGGTGTDSSYASAVLAKGPQGYWKFNEAASPFADSSNVRAAGNNATANGGITTSNTGGPYGASSPYIAFNGTTGFISFAAAPGDAGFVGDTFVLWIKPTAATFVGLIDTQPGAAGVHRNYNTGFFERQGGTSVAIPALSTVNWTHLAFAISRQSGNLRLYVNGVVQTGFPVLFDSANYSWNNTWVLGNINSGGAGWFSGKIAHFAYFNRELQAAEILALYNS